MPRLLWIAMGLGFGSSPPSFLFRSRPQPVLFLRSSPFPDLVPASSPWACPCPVLLYCIVYFRKTANCASFA